MQFSLLFFSKFSHPNIVRFLGISTDSLDQSMYLLLELMEGGDLRTFIRESRPKQVKNVCVLKRCCLTLIVPIFNGNFLLFRNSALFVYLATRTFLSNATRPSETRHRCVSRLPLPGTKQIHSSVRHSPVTLISS